MDFNLIKMENIRFVKSNNHYIVSYNNSKNENKLLLFKTPILYLPFGIEKQFNNYILKLQLKKNKDNTGDLSMFLTFIKNIEKLIEKKFNKNVKSQIVFHDIFDPIIITKILHTSKLIKTTIKQNHSYFNFFNLKKKMSLQTEILIDKIWIQETQIIYKLKLKTINISSV